MDKEELKEWARRELPPYSTKNIHAECLKTNVEFTFNPDSGNKTNPTVDMMRKCRCTVCKKGLVESRLIISSSSS